MTLDGSLLTEPEARALFDEVVDERALATTRELLSKREREVLFHHVVNGLRYGEIATLLVVSRKTVHSHIEHCTLRLGFRSWVDLRDELRRAFTRAETLAEGEKTTRP